MSETPRETSRAAAAGFPGEEDEGGNEFVRAMAKRRQKVDAEGDHWTKVTSDAPHAADAEHADSSSSSTMRAWTKPAPRDATTDNFIPKINFNTAKYTAEGREMAHSVDEMREGVDAVKKGLKEANAARESMEETLQQQCGALGLAVREEREERDKAHLQAVKMIEEEISNLRIQQCDALDSAVKAEREERDKAKQQSENLIEEEISKLRIQQCDALIAAVKAEREERDKAQMQSVNLIEEEISKLTIQQCGALDSVVKAEREEREKAQLQSVNLIEEEISKLRIQQCVALDSAVKAEREEREKLQRQTSELIQSEISTEREERDKAHQQALKLFEEGISNLKAEHCDALNSAVKAERGERDKLHQQTSKFIEEEISTEREERHQERQQTWKLLEEEISSLRAQHSGALDSAVEAEREERQKLLQSTWKLVEESIADLREHQSDALNSRVEAESEERHKLRQDAWKFVEETSSDLRDTLNSAVEAERAKRLQLQQNTWKLIAEEISNLKAQQCDSQISAVEAEREESAKLIEDEISKLKETVACEGASQHRLHDELAGVVRQQRDEVQNELRLQVQSVKQEIAALVEEAERQMRQKIDQVQAELSGHQRQSAGEWSQRLEQERLENQQVQCTQLGELESRLVADIEACRAALAAEATARAQSATGLEARIEEMRRLLEQEKHSHEAAVAEARLQGSAVAAGEAITTWEQRKVDLLQCLQGDTAQRIEEVMSKSRQNIDELQAEIKEVARNLENLKADEELCRGDIDAGSRKHDKLHVEMVDQMEKLHRAMETERNARASFISGEGLAEFKKTFDAEITGRVLELCAEEGGKSAREVEAHVAATRLELSQQQASNADLSRKSTEDCEAQCAKLVELEHRLIADIEAGRAALALEAANREQSAAGYEQRTEELRGMLEQATLAQDRGNSVATSEATVEWEQRRADLLQYIQGDVAQRLGEVRSESRQHSDAVHSEVQSMLDKMNTDQQLCRRDIDTGSKKHLELHAETTDQLDKLQQAMDAERKSRASMISAEGLAEFKVTFDAEISGRTSAFCAEEGSKSVREVGDQVAAIRHEIAQQHSFTSDLTRKCIEDCEARLEQATREIRHSVDEGSSRRGSIDAEEVALTELRTWVGEEFVKVRSSIGDERRQREQDVAEARAVLVQTESGVERCKEVMLRDAALHCEQKTSEMQAQFVQQVERLASTMKEHELERQLEKDTMGAINQRIDSELEGRTGLERSFAASLEQLGRELRGQIQEREERLSALDGRLGREQELRAVALDEEAAARRSMDAAFSDRFDAMQRTFEEVRQSQHNVAEVPSRTDFDEFGTKLRADMLGHLNELQTGFAETSTQRMGGDIKVLRDELLQHCEGVTDRMAACSQEIQAYQCEVASCNVRSSEQHESWKRDFDIEKVARVDLGERLDSCLSGQSAYEVVKDKTADEMRGEMQKMLAQGLEREQRKRIEAVEKLTRRLDLERRARESSAPAECGSGSRSLSGGSIARSAAGSAAGGAMAPAPLLQPPLRVKPPSPQHRGDRSPGGDMLAGGSAGEHLAVPVPRLSIRRTPGTTPPVPPPAPPPSAMPTLPPPEPMGAKAWTPRMFA